MYSIQYACTQTVYPYTEIESFLRMDSERTRGASTVGVGQSVGDSAGVHGEALRHGRAHLAEHQLRRLPQLLRRRRR